MGRLERNIKRRKRRRIIFFSLLTILLLFLLGIGTTNSVMVHMTSLPQEENIFSEYNMSIFVQKIQEFGNEIQWIADVKTMMKSWIDTIQKAVIEMTNRI